MQLVVGGVYSGKRKFVNRMFPDSQWLSAYEKESLKKWQQTYETSDSPLVIEGWEVWIRQEWEKARELEPVRNYFQACITEMKQVEKQQPIILIMLEMGRGVVPMDKNDRCWRDLSGWVLQAAADEAESVHYCWHGLSRQMK